MYYVYVLKSLSFSDQKYVGYTNNLKQRFLKHNAGDCLHTAKYMPWELMVYVAFKDETSAIKFEKYLKSGSGRVFLDKRLLNLGD